MLWFYLCVFPVIVFWAALTLAVGLRAFFDGAWGRFAFCCLGAFPAVCVLGFMVAVEIFNEWGAIWIL